jgi:hypothetical protein
MFDLGTTCQQMEAKAKQRNGMPSFKIRNSKKSKPFTFKYLE